jgi:hypothetical protein
MKTKEAIIPQLWADVFVAYVSSCNSVNIESGFAWADRAVKEFKTRFIAEEEDK